MGDKFPKHIYHSIICIGALIAHEQDDRVKRNSVMPEQMVCTPKLLPRQKWQSAAKIATEINPVNHPPVERLVRVVAGFSPTPEHISVLTTKYWGVAGLRLTVGFLDILPPTFGLESCCI